MRIRSVFSATTGGCLLALFLASCGSTDLASEAEEVADKNCECTTFECTREGTGWFNEKSIVEGDKVEALSAADHERYVAARKRSSECQNALRE